MKLALKEALSVKEPEAQADATIGRRKREDRRRSTTQMHQQHQPIVFGGVSPPNWFAPVACITGQEY